MSDKNLTVKEFWKLSEEDRLKKYNELSPHDKFGVRVTSPMTSTGILCNECKHCRRKEEGIKCDAFPNGIPESHISRGYDENLHMIYLTKEMAKNCNNGIGF